MPNLAPNTTTTPDRAESIALAVADALGLMREAAEILALALAPEPPPEPPPGPGDPEIRARLQRLRALKSLGYAEDPTQEVNP